MKTSKEKMLLEAFINRYDFNGSVKREFQFHPDRKWRFDWAIVADEIPPVAIEYEGGVFMGGGHTRGVIYGANCEKYNEAAIMGWTVLRFTAPMIRAKMHETQIKRALGVA